MAAKELVIAPGYVLRDSSEACPCLWLGGDRRFSFLGSALRCVPSIFVAFSAALLEKGRADLSGFLYPGVSLAPLSL